MSDFEVLPFPVYTINRGIALIRPKQPFIDWVNGYEPDDPVAPEEITSDCTGYLLPDYESEEDAKQYIRENFNLIFEIELDAWYTERSYWPENRDIRMFYEWFEVEFHSLILDMTEKSIRKEEYF